MYRFKAAAAIVGVLLCLSGECFAQTGRNSEMTARINALKARLKNYTDRNLLIKNQENNSAFVGPLTDISEFNGQNGDESAIISCEKLVEEFEARPDVAVTVLFHDEEAEAELNKSIALSKPYLEALSRKQECQRLLDNLKASSEGKKPFGTERPMFAQANAEYLL